MLQLLLQLKENSPGSASRRIWVAAPLLGFARGEAQCPISFLLRYGDVWTDWCKTSMASAGKEETLELDKDKDILAISGYSYDSTGDTYSLQAESSPSWSWSRKSWGPYGTHRPYDGRSLRSSPSNGVTLNHISVSVSGSGSGIKYILRWLYNQIKTWMIVCMVFIDIFIDNVPTITISVIKITKKLRFEIILPSTTRFHWEPKMGWAGQQQQQQKLQNWQQMKNHQRWLQYTVTTI